MRDQLQRQPSGVPKSVIWMAVLLPYASATMLTLAGVIALVAILGLGSHLIAKQTADELLIVLFTGLVVVIVGLISMYWVVLAHLKRLRKERGVDADPDLRPLATWWKSAGAARRLSGALGVTGLLLGIGLVRSPELSSVGWSALVLGLVLILATHFVVRRSSADR
jgi:hypothetical protein